MLQIVVNLFRGTPKFDSLIGLSTCDWDSWLILIIFIIISIVLTYFNVRQIFQEVELKKRFNELHESEEYFQPKVLPFLIFMSFMSGFIG